MDTIIKIENSNERGEEIKSFIDLLINESVGLVISRQLFSDLCLVLNGLDKSDAKWIANYALEKIQPRAISFEDQVTSYRQLLSEIYENEGEWKKAANMLSGNCLNNFEFYSIFSYINIKVANNKRNTIGDESKAVSK